MSAIAPIFARTRFGYDSYSDFWKLVELSGFPTCFVDQIDLQSDNTYITTPVNGELRPHVAYRRTLGPQSARIIWWNLERPDDARELGLSAQLDEILHFVDEVWVSDRYYASLDPRLKFVVLGSHEGLARTIAGLNYVFAPMKTYDVALMAAPVPRREGVIYELKQRGLRVAPNAWGAEREQILRGTHVMLNVHQHENPMPIGEPLRFALAAAYRMVLISERIGDIYPLDHGCLVSAPFSDLVDFVGALSRPASQYGERLHQRLCVELNFRKCVEDALRST